jgi:hypothetical protein
MSDLFDKLVDGAGQVLGGVDKEGSISSAISGLKHRLAEADRKRKLGQLKQQIRELQSQETQAINSLSSQVLALYEAGTLTQPELVSLCRRVDDVRKQITELEAEVSKLQPPAAIPAAEARCPKCSALVPAGAVFCQSCGSRLEPAAPAPSPAAATPAQFCVFCGAQLRPGARFCPTCGKALPGTGDG